MPDHDVAIVGGGPVGLLLACLLAQRGVEVAVYEQRTGADDRSRAIGIHPPGRAALDAAGLGDAFRNEALELDGEKCSAADGSSQGSPSALSSVC